MLRSLTFCSILALICGAHAGADEAAKQMAFFSYFEGTWQVTDVNSDEKGLMKIKRGEGGTSHILEYRLGDVRMSELWGYDPGVKRWTGIGFAQDGERYSEVMMDVPNHDTPKVGDRWFDKHQGILPSGEKTSSRLEFYIESDDSYTVKVTNIMVGDKKQKDVALRNVRQR